MFVFGGFNEGPGRSFIGFLFFGFGPGGTVLQNNFTDSTRFFSPIFFCKIVIQYTLWCVVLGNSPAV